MLMNDKSQLKRNVEQIGFQFALKLARVSADLTNSGRLFPTVLHYCITVAVVSICIVISVWHLLLLWTDVIVLTASVCCF